MTASIPAMNMAFAAHRGLVEYGSIPHAIDYALEYKPIQSYDWFAREVTETQIVEGIEAHFAHETIQSLFGEPTRKLKREVFEIVSGICARLRGEHDHD